MQIKYKGDIIYTYSVRRLVYALCFLAFCIIEQRSKTCSGLDGWSETFRDLTGVVMAVIIMSHYRPAEIKKWKLPYLIWTAVCVIGSPFAYVWGKNNRPFLNDWVIMLLDVVLYGYIVFHTFISVVLEKQYPKLNKKFLMVWLVMMVLMIVSRSTYIWPFCYLVMFGCFYLTDYSIQEQDDLFQGMLDGIILGFFILQGLCFVFRPYDVVRYKGYFSNSNWNALFYVEVLAAVFAKILWTTKNNCKKLTKVYYWIGAGTVLSFELLTIGRAGWLTSIVLLLIFMRNIAKFQIIRHWWRNLAILSLCVLLTFPLCFGAVRYLPPLFHHPVWFWGEWDEVRVHSWDPWNSDKYIDIDEYMEAALGRFFQSFTDLLEHSPLKINAEAAEKIEDVASDLIQEELPSNRIPVLTMEQAQDDFLVRKTIYKFYLEHLNFWGHPYEEQGFQMHKLYWIGHAHNIFLQYGTDFGIPVMFLFMGLIVWGLVLLWKRFTRKSLVEDATSWMYLLIPALFGMFEYAWGVGSLSILMLFVAWRRVICCEEE